MTSFTDLTGRVFGLLKAARIERTAKGIAHWRCECACGNEIVVRAGNLRSGNTKSCGCRKGGRVRIPLTPAQAEFLAQQSQSRKHSA
jgi:hypothetical protein